MKQQVQALVTRQISLPTNTTKEKLYKTLGADSGKEIILLMTPRKAIEREMSIIMPDTSPILLPGKPGIVCVPEYLLIILNTEQFLRLCEFERNNPI